MEKAVAIVEAAEEEENGGGNGQAPVETTPAGGNGHATETIADERAPIKTRNRCKSEKTLKVEADFRAGFSVDQVVARQGVSAANARQIRSRAGLTRRES